MTRPAPAVKIAPPPAFHGARVGCAAWLDRTLVDEGQFYPARRMTAAERLWWYASFFDTVEVNASYYAIPSEETTRHWAERTPDGFFFGVKAWAPMTGHRTKALATPAALRRYFLDVPRTAGGDIEARHFPPAALDGAFEIFRQALAPLAETGKLGYVLFQLAPWVLPDAATKRYLAGLPKRLPGWPIAVEVRNPAWIPKRTDETLAFFRDNGLAHVAVDAPWMPLVPEATAPLFILRCHGQNVSGWQAQMAGRRPTVAEKYDYLYSDKQVDALARALSDAKGDAPARALIFNNNNKNYPIQNALAARAALGQKAPTVEAARRLWKPDRAQHPELSLG